MGAAAVVVYLALGSNRGDRLRWLRQGLDDLARRGVEVRRCSHAYSGPYVGPGGPQPEYVNAVAEGRTLLLPLELLEVLHAVEAAAGRPERTHMQPRTLDVDLLFYGGWSVRHPRLVVPHPRLATRRFVLEPLAELGVLERLPGSGLPASLAMARRTQRLAILPERLIPGEADAAAPG